LIDKYSCLYNVPREGAKIKDKDAKASKRATTWGSLPYYLSNS